MSVRLISLLKAFLIAVVISLGIRVVAATSVTNEIDTTRNQVEVSRCNFYDSVGLPRNTELKAAISQLTSAYCEQYGELKCVHDKFMMHVTILVTILGIAIAIVGVAVTVLTIVFGIKNRRVIHELCEKVESSYVRLTEVEKSYSQLRKRYAAESRTSMRFAWVEFLAAIKRGSLNGREIVAPLYHSANTLELSGQVKDNDFLNASINDVSKVIDVYRRVVATRPGVHGKFVSLVRRKGILANSSHFVNLVKTLGGKTESLETVLKFMNEFGIKMFGEVA